MKYRWILLLLCLMGGGFIYWWYERRDHSQDAVILVAAQRYGLEPALVKAIVWRESKFNPEARGRAGEIGLMQVRNAAAEEWAAAERVRSFAQDQLLDPGTNTLAGTWYLGHLLKRYPRADNPLPYALAAYNAGAGNVLKWSGGFAQTNSAMFIEQIGFPGTRQYVKSVMRRYHRYR